MARSFLVPIDLHQLEALNLRLHNLAAAPATPVEGQIYYDSAFKASFVWNGTAWANADATKLIASIPNAALLTNPLARGNHTGTQVAATISDLATTVHGYPISSFAAAAANIGMAGYKLTGLGTPTTAGDSAEYSWVLARSLSAFAAPTANLAMGGFKLTGLAPPTAAGDGAEYSWVIGQVQASAAGIASKPPVDAIATANVVLSGLAPIDGYTPVAGNRILVVGQTLPAANGVYTAAAGAWARTNVDGPAPGEIEPGAMWMVVNGTVNSGSQWRVATTGPIVVGTTPLSIVQFGAASSYSAGNGLTLTGSQFAVQPAAAGGISVAAGGVSLDPAVAVRKFATTIGDGAQTSFVVTHNLNTQDVTIGVRTVATPYSFVECDQAATSVNTATISFAQPPAAAAYRVVVHG